MFSMIITIVSIALVAILAAACLYYGASYVSDGKTRTAVTRALQEGNQIVGAFELYRADQGKMPEGTAEKIQEDLVTKEYLSSWPGSAWKLQTDFAVRDDLDDKQCLAVNKRMGIEGIPACDTAGITDKTFCCSVAGAEEGTP